MKQAVVEAIEVAHEKATRELAKVDADIEGLVAPLPAREDYPEGCEGTVSYMKDYAAHIENHLHGKYSTGKMEKLYDKKLELTTQIYDLANAAWGAKAPGRR